MEQGQGREKPTSSLHRARQETFYTLLGKQQLLLDAEKKVEAARLAPLSKRTFLMAGLNKIKAKMSHIVQLKKEKEVKLRQEDKPKFGSRRRIEINMASLTRTLSWPVDHNTVFVVGPARSNVDTLIATIFEAVRRNSIHPHLTFVPYVYPSPILPLVCTLLPPTMIFLLEKISDVSEASNLVLIGCQARENLENSRVIDVLDNHLIDPRLREYGLADHMSLAKEDCASVVLQVYIKMVGCGIGIDSVTARILAKAVMLGTDENCVLENAKGLGRFTEIEQLALYQLQEIAGMK